VHIIVADGLACRLAQAFHRSKFLICVLLAVDITPSRFEYTQQTDGARSSHDYAFLYLPSTWGGIMALMMQPQDEADLISARLRLPTFFQVSSHEKDPISGFSSRMFFPVLQFL
jgi:hypothetical protein